MICEPNIERMRSKLKVSLRMSDSPVSEYRILRARILTNSTYMLCPLLAFPARGDFCEGTSSVL